MTALMLLSFPNRDHPDVLVGEGCLRIGGAPGNDVVLAELREQHARLTRDSRGIVLEIVDPSARAHVNARPVREKAFVRLGDTVCLDAVTIAVSQSESAEEFDVNETSSGGGSLRGVLRGMSGSAFGKSFPIADGLSVATTSDGTVHLGGSFGVVVARIDVMGGEPVLRSDEPSGSLVNGRRVQRVRLQSGDQLAFGRERFVVETCGNSAARQQPVFEPSEAVEESIAESVDDRDHAGSSHAVWWLIAAAAVMGLILATVLLHGI